MEGWIKLHRKMLDNPIVMKDGDYCIVWIYLLLNASHKDYQAMFNGQKITLHSGQLITGRKSIAQSTHVNESKVSRILKLLKSEQQIEQLTSARNSLITIVNWNDYQKSEQLNEQLVNNYRTASEHKQEYKNNKNVRKKGFSVFDSRDYDFEELEKKIIK